MKKHIVVLSVALIITVSFCTVALAKTSPTTRCLKAIEHTHYKKCPKCGSAKYKEIGYGCCGGFIFPDATDLDQFDYGIPAKDHCWVDTDYAERQCRQCGAKYKGPSYVHKYKYGGNPGCW